MRIIIIAVGRDIGDPLNGLPMADGPIYKSPATRLDISPPDPNGGWVRVDGIALGQIVQVLIDHEDEKAPEP